MSKTHINRLLLCSALLSLVALTTTRPVSAQENTDTPSTAVTETANPATAENSQVVAETNTPTDTIASPTNPTATNETAVATDTSQESATSEVATPSATVNPQAEAVAENSPAMSDAEKRRAIAQMGANQGDVWVWSDENKVYDDKGNRISRGPNGGPGQFNGGSVGLGGRANFDPAADWYYLAYKREGMTDEEAMALFNSERGKWMNEFDPWGVVMEMTDNTATNAWVDVRNMQAYILRQGTNVWEKIVDHPAAVQWVNQFKGDMSSDTGLANQEALAQGGTAIEVLPKQDRVAHWGSDQAHGITGQENIRAVLVVVEARISEKSDPNAKLGIQVGGDWKFGQESIKPVWYPGAGLSGVQRLTNNWERYYFVSLTGIQDAMEERAISPELFLSSHVPLADMERPVPSTPDQRSLDPQVNTLSQNSKQEVVPQRLASQKTASSQTQLPQTGTKESSSLVSWLALALSGLGLGFLFSKKKAKKA